MKRISLQHRLLYLAAAGAIALAASGCSTSRPEQYASQMPKLDIEKYFNGTLDAHGMFQDRSGDVIKRFVVVMNCSWQGDTGVFDEDFVYADGSKQKRVWTVKRTAPGRYSATAADVVGTAEGVVSGNALRWTYVLALPVEGRIINVKMEDWMYLIDEKVMLNRTAMSKFGVGLGAVTLAFTKRTAAP